MFEVCFFASPMVKTSNEPAAMNCRHEWMVAVAGMGGIGPGGGRLRQDAVPWRDRGCGGAGRWLSLSGW